MYECVARLERGRSVKPFNHQVGSNPATLTTDSSISEYFCSVIGDQGQINKHGTRDDLPISPSKKNECNTMLHTIFITSNKV